MWLIDGKISGTLPFRLRLPDGSTRTSLCELSEVELAEINIFPVDELKPEKEWTQYYGAPDVIVSDGRATATYPVLDYSSEEVKEILSNAKGRKLADIASARYEAEIAGVEAGGMTIKTDRESQALITGAALQAFVDPDYTCTWKTVDGFVELTSLQIKGAAWYVRSHVQGCFNKEATLVAQVQEAQTPEELESIVW